MSKAIIECVPNFSEGVHTERVLAILRAMQVPGVSLLDWSQDESRVGDAKSPFGKLEDWSKPTVLLGSAGLLLATQWQLIGGAG